MITTITTVTTVTTVTAAAATALGAVGTVLLICLLIIKELSDSHGGARSQKLARNTVLVIMPLLFAFATIVFVKLMEVL
jgi:4-amino-4-deoxy-L-arabinose transferase-like glycosyltransferase